MTNNKDQSEYEVTGLSRGTIWVISALLGLTVGSIGYLHCATEYSKLNHEVQIETGSAITADLFAYDTIPNLALLTDVSKIDTNVPGSYGLTLKTWFFKSKVSLDIKDTVKPVGTPIPQAVYANDLPDVYEVVTDLYDYSGTVTAEYVDPDISQHGLTNVEVKLTDLYNNTRIIEVPFDVTLDTTPPVIEGTKDLTFYTDTNMKFLKDVTVTDDYASNPTLTVDTSNLKPSEPGEYEITYSATDDVGNTSEITVKVTLNKKPNNYYEEEVVYALAQPIYDQIIPDNSISDVEKAMRIFKWAYENIQYTGKSDKSHWTGGAYDGFTNMKGDCYNTYACCKVLLDIAGIPNRYVYGSRNRPHHIWHCWNLVQLDGQWYHCDATKTKRNNKTYLFMATDAEIDPKFPIKSDGLPARATRSVQSRIDRTNLRLREG